MKWTGFVVCHESNLKLGEADALSGSAIEASETLLQEAQSDCTNTDKVLQLFEAEYLEKINEVFESYAFPSDNNERMS